MEKLPMCRLCLAENVRMYVVVNKDLHELYERLTDNPFVTGDSRPMLACFICCTQLKQCCQLQRKCLEAEELLTQMMNEDCELNPPTNQHRFGCFNGLIISPMVYVSINSDDECQKENITVKEELPAVCERLDDVIESEEEHQSDELELENLNRSYSEGIPAQQSDSEDDVPLIEIKTEVEEEEVSRKKRRASDTTRSDVAKKSKLFIQGKKPGDAITENVKKNEESDTKVTQNTQKWTPVAKTISSTLQPERTKLEDVITEEQRTELSDTEVVRTSDNYTSKPDPDFEESSTCTLPRVDKSIQNNSLATNCHKEYIKCNISNKGLDSDDIKKNLRLCVKDKRFKCDICPRSFRAMAHLTAHIRTHTGEIPFKCDICQRCFSRNANLTRHIRTHSGEKPFKCDICQRCFSRDANLTIHIRTHTAEKPFKCDICQRCFSRDSNLTRHNIRAHTKKPFECDICQRCFDQKDVLKSHIRTHIHEKPYKCDICQRCFRWNSHLTTHIHTHTGEKPFKCDICMRSFTQKSHLTKHIRTHTGEKPFECDICQRCFGQKDVLKSHILTHIHEKSYKCDICQKCFAHKTHLTSHNCTHTGEKPFKCDVCQSCFTERIHLKQHMRTHTGEKPFKCDICQRCFSQKCGLSRHIRTHT